MSTDYQILLQKFNNFKSFVSQVSPKREVIKDYENMSDSEFLLFGLGFLLPNKSKLQFITTQMSQKLNITGEGDIEKIHRYLECFCEYLGQMNNNEELLKSSIVDVAKEQNLITTINP